MDTTPHSCGRRGHHPTELLKPPVGALGPSRSFQAAVGSGNSCQPSAHRLEPRHTQRLTQGPSVSESKIYSLLPVIYQFLPVGPLVSYQSRPVPIIARWQLLRPSVRESAPVLQPAAAAGPGVGRQVSGAPPAGRRKLARRIHQLYLVIHQLHLFIHQLYLLIYREKIQLVDE